MWTICLAVVGVANPFGKMAAGEDYLYCTVCRRNHNDGRKHIFTRQHKKRLVEIIDKFAKKVILI